MLVMKFGGASVRDADAIRNIAEIIIRHKEAPCLIVISASGKTTNHLEELAALAQGGKEAEALAKLEAITRFHNQIVEALFGQEAGPVLEKTGRFFREISRIVNGILLLEEFPPRTYDRIVAFGELLSTTIVAEYLQWVLGDCIWLDARQLVKTDASYKAANVIWSVTREKIQQQVLPLLKPHQVVVTQGFIGSTLEGKTTTLGREGSDYTAAIFANCLDADMMMVWKDVRGVLNGDPRIMAETIKIDDLSYEEAVEMTFYGATVIHPKTIKPIFNKDIPLYVKCFKDVNEPGTRISSQTNQVPITSYIVKPEQTFIQIKPRDFSFMDEQLMQEIFQNIYKTGLKINLVQNTAISMLLCADDKGDAPNAFESLLLDKFVVSLQHGLKLNTILNFTVKDLKQATDAVMVQQHDNKLYFVK